MYPILLTLPTLMVSGLYCLWSAYRVTLVGRRKKLRERITYMLWVAATGRDGSEHREEEQVYGAA